MVKLFEPFELGEIRLKNRIVMSPMCMYSAREDGQVTDWHKTHYESRAIGQVGLIILEATAVLPEGRITENDLGIWNDEQLPGLKELCQKIQENGAKAGIQLGHAGRKARVSGEIFAPCALAYNENSKLPKMLTVQEIKTTVLAFKKAALRAKSAGFDVIEIHAAHGYLLNEFLSPLTNHRKDDYGGSIKNRYRILGEVISAIRTIWDKPIFVRISASDWTKGGMTPQDYVPIASWMKEQGVDVIDVSSGAVVPTRIVDYPGYQVPFAEIIKNEAQMPTGAVGLITSAIQAEEILQNDRADLIFLGRELLRDPYWAYRAARKLEETIEVPEQYKRGWKF